MEKKTADKFISVQSVAERLSCTDDYVYMLIRNGSIQAIKIGQRAIRVSESSLQEFIAVGRIDPEDYFAPEEPPSTEPKPQKPKVARSNWMSR